MKFDCGPTPKERADARQKKVSDKIYANSKWHKCFAWLPVRVGPHDCRWLEAVERRATNVHIGYVSCFYRVKDSPIWEYRPFEKSA